MLAAGSGISQIYMEAARGQDLGTLLDVGGCLLRGLLSPETGLSFDDFFLQVDPAVSDFGPLAVELPFGLVHAPQGWCSKVKELLCSCPQGAPMQARIRRVFDALGDCGRLYPGGGVGTVPGEREAAEEARYGVGSFEGAGRVVSYPTDKVRRARLYAPARGRVAEGGVRRPPFRPPAAACLLPPPRLRSFFHISPPPAPRLSPREGSTRAGAGRVKGHPAALQVRVLAREGRAGDGRSARVLFRSVRAPHDMLSHTRERESGSGSGRKAGGRGRRESQSNGGRQASPPRKISFIRI